MNDDTFKHSSGNESSSFKLDHSWWYEVFTIWDPEDPIETRRNYLLGPYGGMHFISEDLAVLYTGGLASPLHLRCGNSYQYVHNLVPEGRCY